MKFQKSVELFSLRETDLLKGNWLKKYKTPIYLHAIERNLNAEVTVECLFYYVGSHRKIFYTEVRLRLKTSGC